MLTTSNQAKELKELGYKGNVYDGHYFYYFGRAEYIFDNLDQTGCFDESILDHPTFVYAPSVSSALQWIRENKGIVCAVGIDNYIENSNKYRGGFMYRKDGIGRLENIDSFDDYPSAESALLTAILEYLKEKK